MSNPELVVRLNRDMIDNSGWWYQKDQVVRAYVINESSKLYVQGSLGLVLGPNDYDLFVPDMMPSE